MKCDCGCEFEPEIKYQHRLICGDSTDLAVVERVMGGEKAVLVFADPPYNIDYSDNILGRTIPNDKQTVDDYRIFLKHFLQIAAEVSSNAPAYVWFATGQIVSVLEAIKESPWNIKNWIIWAKDCGSRNMTSDYRWMFEAALYLVKSFDSLPRFYGDCAREGNVWNVPDLKSFAALTDTGKRAMNKMEYNFHPNGKPVALADKALNNSSKQSDIVLDPFLGSGTTLIACERLGRKCRGIEIEPKYVAVTLERWATMTGKTPVLIDG